MLLLRFYAKVYYVVKRRLRAGNLPGFGILSKWAWRDSIVTVDGVRMVFDHEAAGNYACVLGGHFNETETHLFVHRVLDRMPDPCCFVDVGANVGEMVVDFPRHPKVRKTIAFEPSARCSSIIERSCALNELRHVTVVRKAVGEKIGRGLMPRSAHDQHFTEVRVSHPAATAGEEDLDVVEMTTLDATIPDPAGLWIILIDVEGAELAVMRGGPNFIRAVKPLIIFEYHEGTRTRFSLGEVRAELGQDYELFRLRSDGFLDRELLRTWNCVAVPRMGPFHSIIADILIDGQANASSPDPLLDGRVGKQRLHADG
jgi:FkbM family methyltransferase